MLVFLCYLGTMPALHKMEESLEDSAVMFDMRKESKLFREISHCFYSQWFSEDLFKELPDISCVYLCNGLIKALDIFPFA